MPGNVRCLQGTNDKIEKSFLTNERAERNLGQLISKHPPLTLRQLADAGPNSTSPANNGGLTCVHTLVAGAGSLQMSMSRARVMPFRCAPVRNMERACSMLCAMHGILIH